MNSIDIEAARVSYEKAVAAGNAEAAVRLGVTHDPDFLAKAGLPNVRADASAPQYWYGLAGVLEQNQSQLPSQGTELVRASEPVVSGTITEPATEDDQFRIQTTDLASPKLMRTRLQGLSSQTRHPKPVAKRYTQNQRPTNGSTCPHLGHCLTPP